MKSITMDTNNNDSFNLKKNLENQENYLTDERQGMIREIGKKINEVQLFYHQKIMLNPIVIKNPYSKIENYLYIDTITKNWEGKIIIEAFTDFDEMENTFPVPIEKLLNLELLILLRQMTYKDGFLLGILNERYANEDDN